MAYIKVDHSKFESAATEVDKYTTLLKNQMKSAQGEVTNLSSNWQGGDFSQFKTEFDKVDNRDSTHSKMVKSLDSYADFLRYASSQYKSAQIRAVNRANSLPRW